MPGNAADRAAAQCARAAEEHVFVFRLNTPCADLIFPLRKWKRKCVMKNVAVIHSELVLDVYGAFAFDARTAVTRQSETIFDRLFQPLINAGEIFFLRFPSH